MTRFGEFGREGDNPAVDRERLSSAAYRLKHDFGKAVRWNASRAPLARLSDLGRDELVALDEATLVLQDETRALWQDVIATSGSSP
jgi:hypothetical protein